MLENEITKIIVDKCYNIHYKLGAGLFESVYEEILFYELKKSGLFVERQKPIPVIWDNIKMDMSYKADLIVENKVIIEIKSVESITDIHKKQLLTYLKLTGLKVGLLVNFNVRLIKEGILRIANNL